MPVTYQMDQIKLILWEKDVHYTNGCISWLLPGGCCICLEQSAGVSTGIAVTASFSQQTEDRAFCPVVQLF